MKKNKTTSKLGLKNNVIIGEGDLGTMFPLLSICFLGIMTFLVSSFFVDSVFWQGTIAFTSSYLFSTITIYRVVLSTNEFRLSYPTRVFKRNIYYHPIEIERINFVKSIGRSNRIFVIFFKVKSEVTKRTIELSHLTDNKIIKKIISRARTHDIPIKIIH